LQACHDRPVATRPTSGPAYFDGWYADMGASSGKDEIMQRHLGLPPRLLSTSLLSWSGLDEVVPALRLAAGELLLDLACGRGGYGLEISRRTGCRLVGVDFSAEAVRQAGELAERRGAEAEFRVGDLAETGLVAGSVDAVLCVDSVQFAVEPDLAHLEVRRVLRPGGRVVLTCWELAAPDGQDVPERLREVHLEDRLRRAGFVDVEVQDRPDWRRLERAMWEEAVALDPAGDPALQSFHDEGVRSLVRFATLRRVLATATAP
jgi:SAM-dependent methyltransferase